MHLSPTTTGLTRLILHLITFIALALAVTIPSQDVTKRTGLLEKRSRCGIHVTQYQSAPGVAVLVKDNSQRVIGQIGRTNFDNNGYVNVYSQLRYTVVVHLVGGGNLEFGYAADHWSTTDGRCSVGGYDHGARQMDCGFAC